LAANLTRQDTENNNEEEDEYNGEEEEDDESELEEDEFFYDDSLASTIRRLKRNARNLNLSPEMNSTRRKDSTQSDIVLSTSQPAERNSLITSLEATPLTLGPQLNDGE
jgi:hypothetical protein